MNGKYWSVRRTSLSVGRGLDAPILASPPDSVLLDPHRPEPCGEEIGEQLFREIVDFTHVWPSFGVGERRTASADRPRATSTEMGSYARPRAIDEPGINGRGAAAYHIRSRGSGRRLTDDLGPATVGRTTTRENAMACTRNGARADRSETIGYDGAIRKGCAIGDGVAGVREGMSCAGDGRWGGRRASRPRRGRLRRWRKSCSSRDH